MDRYCAAIKLPGFRPFHKTYEAGSVHEAIQKMMQAAEVGSTEELEEAEILLVTRTSEGKPAYVPVFTKLGTGQKPKVTLVRNEKEPEPPAPKEAEDTYELPYKVEVL